MFDLIFCIGSIALVIPVQFKNWFTVLSVYVIVFTPDIIVPVVPKPTVESTVITLAPTETFSIDFVFGTTIKSLLTSELSSYPINKPIL